MLDTDGVNAFASPGGFVHITRGALGLIRNEAELAGVLGHEIAHVARKHTVNAIQKNKAVAAGVNSAAGGRSALLERMANQAYAMVLENNFDRGDELDADKVGVQLAQKAGYGTALDAFLTRLDERNKDQAERNGLFASHPETKERIDKIKQLGAAAKTSALVESRYKTSIKYEVPPIDVDCGRDRGLRRAGRLQQGAGERGGEEGRAEEARLRSVRAQVDGFSGEAVDAGVRLGWRSRTGRGPGGKGRRQPHAREGQLSARPSWTLSRRGLRSA